MNTETTLRQLHLEHVELSQRLEAVGDFGRQDLRSTMDEASYRESVPAFILWEGVTNHLSEEAVDSPLRRCARTAPGSVDVFTYVHRDILHSPESSVGCDRLFAALRRAGEPFTFGIRPEDHEGFLAQRGLVVEGYVGAAGYRARYYGDAARRMVGHEFHRVAFCRTGERVGGTR